MSDDEKAFLQAIIEAPDDEAIRLIYADWLDEHERDSYASWLRIESSAQQKIRDGIECTEELEQLRTLFFHIDLEWCGIVSRGKIENCRAYTLPCPTYWQKVEQPNIFEKDSGQSNLSRRCATCDREIYLVLSQTEAQARLWIDQLVTISLCLSLQQDDLEPNSAAMTLEIQALEQREARTASLSRKMQQRARRRFEG